MASQAQQPKRRRPIDEEQDTGNSKATEEEDRADKP